MYGEFGGGGAGGAEGPFTAKTSPFFGENALKPKYEKLRKIHKNRGFRNFSNFFLYFGFGRGFGVYFGVYFGLQRGFVFCRGRRNSQFLEACLIYASWGPMFWPSLRRSA